MEYIFNNKTSPTSNWPVDGLKREPTALFCRVASPKGRPYLIRNVVVAGFVEAWVFDGYEAVFAEEIQ